MDNPRAEKVAVVDEVRQRFDEADAAILTEYRGLKVKDLADLRRSLATAGGEYRVYKNTLVRFAARGAGLDGLEPLLEGPTGIAFVKGDAAAVAKSLRDYARTQPLLIIKGGVLGDKVLSPAETTALAELPPREVLLARLAGAFAAPMQQLAGLMQALPRNLAYGLAALRDQLESAAGGVAEPAPAPASDAASEPDVAVEPDAALEPDAAVGPDAAPEVATVLDDATSPALIAEAADPTPPE